MSSYVFTISTICMCLLLSCSPAGTGSDDKQASSADTLALKRDSLLTDSSKLKELIKEYDFLKHVDTLRVGDVNGDGRKDTAILQNYVFFSPRGDLDSQYVNISFTCRISHIKHDNGFSGLITSVGDLDGNKTEELIYFPDWYQSNSGMFYVYGLKEEKWLLFTKGELRRDIVREAKDPVAYLRKRVKKIDNTSFKITEHLWRDTDIVDSISIIKLK